MKRLVEYWTGIPRATKLMIFATVVASLRFMLLHAVAVGYQLGDTFKYFEVASGVAFAVLEGVALAYVSKRWRKLRPAGVGWVYWSILAVGQLALLVAITWTTGMAFMVVRRNAVSSELVLIDDVLSQWAAAIWSMMVAGINALMVMLIGIVEDDEPEPSALGGERVDWVPQAVLADVFLNQWQQRHQREPIVPEFVHYFRQQTGQAVTDDQADQYILEWRSANGKSGARPVKPVLPVPGYNGNGAR